MTTAIGTLETIAVQLQELNVNLMKVLSSDNVVNTPEKSRPAKATAPKETEEEATAPAAKKTAKKTAAKTTAKKTAAKPKADDLSNMVVFKKALFDAAEKSGVADVMPKLKTYLKAQGYAASDEIEVDDREDFVNGVREHFEELAETAEDEDEDFDL